MKVRLKSGGHGRFEDGRRAFYRPGDVLDVGPGELREERYTLLESSNKPSTDDGGTVDDTDDTADTTADTVAAEETYDDSVLEMEWREVLQFIKGCDDVGLLAFLLEKESDRPKPRPVVVRNITAKIGTLS